MTGWRSVATLAAACLLLAPPALAGDVAAEGAVGGGAVDGGVEGSRLFSFAGDEVIESSGLVDRGSTVFTNNDSGDDAIVYGIDPCTGRTGSRTTYAEAVTDVEAIAPGADGTIWAADIGDNKMNRDGVSVYRVHPQDGDHPGVRFALAYPDGSHNAETLLVQPRTQRVLVVSKSPFGGTVYAAPRDLRSGGVTNRLSSFAQVDGLVTDGAFLPDGRRVVLRTYGTASVYTFPGFDLIGTVRLPTQPQGEGISVSSTGRVLVSSEGVHADVLRLSLPDRLTSGHPPRSQAGQVRPSSRPAGVQDATHSRGAGDWAGIGLVAAALAAIAYAFVRAGRRRGPRTR